jgi:hypothetical protein
VASYEGHFEGMPLDWNEEDRKRKDSAEYRRAIEKLTSRVRVIYESERKKEWSPTPTRKECERVAKALDEVAELLATTDAGMLIESVHQDRGKPQTIVGEDGWPVEEESYFEWSSYQAIKWRIRDLAESARKAAAELPDPRTKFALPHAATGLLHIYHCHGISCPTDYIDGDGVADLKEIAEKAGIHLSPEAYRKVLKEALCTFDPHFWEHFHYLYK